MKKKKAKKKPTLKEESFFKRTYPKCKHCGKRSLQNTAWFSYEIVKSK